MMCDPSASAVLSTSPVNRAKRERELVQKTCCFSGVILESPVMDVMYCVLALINYCICLLYTIAIYN